MRSKELQEKINSGDTELQRSYLTAIDRIIELRAEKQAAYLRIENIKREIEVCEATIERCKERAAEQNASDIF